MKQLFSIAIFLILGFAVFCQEAVDLGLSVKWATCNVGANKPEEYGNYYTFDEAQELSDSNWRVPTIEEYLELVDNCNYIWTTQNGVKGGLFTSKTNGNSIFLPAGGNYRYGSDVSGVSRSGNCWSSSVNSYDYSDAYYLYFYYEDAGTSSGYNHFFRFSVRLVQNVK